MSDPLSVNPWLDMWIRPRQTMRLILAYHVNYRLMLLCAFYGFQSCLAIAQSFFFGLYMPLILTLLISLAVAVPLGYLAFNISALLLSWTGKLLKGGGSFKEIRAATAWSSVPTILGIVIWVFLIVICGNALFMPSSYVIMPPFWIRLSMLIAGVLQLISGVWSFIIFLHALGEVQKFSAWMALLNAFLTGLLVFILTIGWIFLSSLI